MGGNFDQEFSDEVSGGTMAADRPGFKSLLQVVRSGDIVYVYAVDRLGRDALDVQSVVRGLMDNDITVYIHGLGPIARGTGELILAVLAQVAEMERKRILERMSAGRAVAKVAVATTGRTHNGRPPPGRQFAHDGAKVYAWRKANNATQDETARHFKVSVATVKRYCAEARLKAVSSGDQAYSLLSTP
jgi:putative DNA-invertase from lambdoid prophage Rac